MSPLKVYVGYDGGEDIAWQVCRFSLRRHAGPAITVHSLRQPALRELGLYTRPVDAQASTEFSLTRFLTPYLAATHGWSLYVDCDFLFTTDVTGILAGLDTSKAAYVVQHEYSPANTMKMNGRAQHHYPRKNWSSLMLFNGAHPDVRALAPDVVNSATPGFLHRFAWLRDDADLGVLDMSWNFLEGEYPVPQCVPNAIHYTNGGPWLENWRDVAFGSLWTQERRMYETSLARDLPQSSGLTVEQ